MPITPPQPYSPQFPVTPKYGFSAASSDNGTLEDQPYASTSASSGASSPVLSPDEDEKRPGVFINWKHQPHHQPRHHLVRPADDDDGGGEDSSQRTSTTTPDSSLLQRRHSHRPHHSRNISESFVQLAEALSAPLINTLRSTAATVPQLRTFADSSRRPLQSSRPQSSSSSGSARRTQAHFRRALRLLSALVGLVLVSSLLPASSSLNLWHILRDQPFRAAPPIPSPQYDVKNQKLASGKGWGWNIGDQLATDGAAATVPHREAHTPAQQAQAEHDFAYPASSPSTSDEDSDASAHAAYPDIPCQLDSAAFAQHYKLTPNFKYARRFVTAKASPPDLDRPNGFDPHPRAIAEPIVQDWNTLQWGGFAPEELCADLKGRKKEACIVKEARKKQALAGVLGSDHSSPARIVAKALQQERRDVGAAGMTKLQSCSSSTTPLELPTYPVPRTRTQPHEIILGLASDAGRMFEYIAELSYSFAYSGLHLLLNMPPDPRVPELRKTLDARGIRATILESPEEDYLRRWVELPSLLSDFADPGLTKWVMVADDDTFWLSIPKLLKMLDKYDADKPYYIGALTDDWRQAGSGMIAYGGGGVILSMPLLDELQPHWSTCTQGHEAGDYRLSHCVYAHTHTRLTIEWGLLQTDLHGDIRGLLESGRDITTMHHWRSWNTGFDPVLIARAGAVCGSECLLQRFLLDGPNATSSSAHDEKFLFVHGLSLTLFPTPLPDFSKTELTWKVWGNSEFSHAIGPTRARLREGRPLLSRSELELGSSAKTQQQQQQQQQRHSHWKETWMLEDVRLDSNAGGLASNWDSDGRGIREIYIKRANRPRGYVKANGQETVTTAAAATGNDGAMAEGDADEDDDGEEADEDVQRHKNLEGSIRGLVGKLFGLDVPLKAGGDEEARREKEARAEEVVRQQLLEEEQDSVIELVWV